MTLASSPAAQADAAGAAQLMGGTGGGGQRVSLLRHGPARGFSLHMHSLRLETLPDASVHVQFAEQLGQPVTQTPQGVSPQERRHGGGGGGGGTECGMYDGVGGSG